MDRKQLIEKRLDEIGALKQGMLPADEGAWVNAPLSLVLAVFEEAHAPSDDEREALDRIIEPFFDRAVDYDDGSRDDAGLRDEILAAGFHRTVQGEPKHDESCGERCNHCQVCGEGILYGSRCPEHYLSQQSEPDLMDRLKASLQPAPKPQGEPSDAQVKAAQVAWDKYWEIATPDDYRQLDAMRAALRAATETGGEHRA